MKKYFILIIISSLNCQAQKFVNCPPLDFGKRRYRFTIFDQKFINQPMRFEPYTGNVTGYTNPLA